MNLYDLAYRVGLTPWERYGRTARLSIGSVLDRATEGNPAPRGRALDIGCGRGQYATELAERGWDVVGIDFVSSAIAAANRRDISGARFLIADVTNLRSQSLGNFDFFLDIGCFQGLSKPHGQAMGEGVTTLANPDASLLMLAFQPVRGLALAGGVSTHDVEDAFPEWAMLSVEPAETVGLGWPLNKTKPQWYRLALNSAASDAASNRA